MELHLKDKASKKRMSSYDIKITKRMSVNLLETCRPLLKHVYIANDLRQPGCIMKINITETLFVKPKKKPILKMLSKNHFDLLKCTDGFLQAAKKSNIISQAKSKWCVTNGFKKVIASLAQSGYKTSASILYDLADDKQIAWLKHPDVLHNAISDQNDEFAVMLMEKGSRIPNAVLTSAMWLDNNQGV